MSIHDNHVVNQLCTLFELITGIERIKFCVDKVYSKGSV